ncbi:MAG: disulfide bond formation protein B [Thiobacillaceae bacterium]
MKRIPTSLFWLAIALAGMALVAASFLMVAFMKLQPCPLCIAQRTLFMLMGVVALVAFFARRNLAGRIAGGLTVLTALSGAGVAGYQVWMQHQPAHMFSCGADTNFVEDIVYWLGKQVPVLFDAPGVCQDTALLIFGQSLAVWALVAFAASAVLGLWALLRKGTART